MSDPKADTAAITFGIPCVTPEANDDIISSPEFRSAGAFDAKKSRSAAITGDVYSKIIGALAAIPAPRFDTSCIPCSAMAGTLSVNELII